MDYDLKNSTYFCTFLFLNYNFVLNIKKYKLWDLLKNLKPLHLKATL